MMSSAPNAGSGLPSSLSHAATFEGRQELSGIYFVLRTHFWSPLVEKTAVEWGRIFGKNLLIMTDDSRGPVPTGHFRKIASTTKALARIGLPTYPSPKQSAWQNGDYAFYLADHVIKDYRFLFVAEYDVFAKIADLGKWLDFVTTCAAHDVCAKNFGPRAAEWRWLPALQPLYAEPCGALVALFGFRPHVARTLLEARLRHGARFRSGEISQWPQNEGFVGSEIKLHPEWRYFDLRDSPLVGRHAFSATNPHLEHIVQGYDAADGLYHPVVEIDRYVVKLRRSLRTAASPRDFANLTEKICATAPVIRGDSLATLIDDIKRLQPADRAQRLIGSLMAALPPESRPDPNAAGA